MLVVRFTLVGTVVGLQGIMDLGSVTVNPMDDFEERIHDLRLCADILDHMQDGIHVNTVRVDTACWRNIKANFTPSRWNACDGIRWISYNHLLRWGWRVSWHIAVPTISVFFTWIDRMHARWLRIIATVPIAGINRLNRFGIMTRWILRVSLAVIHWFNMRRFLTMDSIRTTRIHRFICWSWRFRGVNNRVNRFRFI